MIMRHHVKQAIALFFLLASLFPLAEKTLHELSHAGDSHCDSFSQVHLHQEEHHCEICDFVLDGFIDSVSGPLLAACPILPETKTSPLPFITIDQPHYLFGLKAPPVS